MNKTKFGLVVLIIMVTTACQSFSTADSPVSESVQTNVTKGSGVSVDEISSPVAPAAGNGIVIDAPKEIDEYFDLRAISGAPKDFDDLCYYGAALFRHPSVAKGSDYDARGG